MAKSTLLFTRRAAQLALEKKKQFLATLLAEGSIDYAGIRAEIKPYFTLRYLLEKITQEEFDAILRR